LTGQPGMNTVEFIWWKCYYNEYPYGDFRRDMEQAIQTRNLLAPYSKDGLLSLNECLAIPFEHYCDVDIPSEEKLIEKMNNMFGKG